MRCVVVSRRRNRPLAIWCLRWCGHVWSVASCTRRQRGWPLRPAAPWRATDADTRWISIPCWTGPVLPVKAAHPVIGLPLAQ